MAKTSRQASTVDLRNLRHIAIGGGGAAGVAPIGAVMCLYEYGLLNQVECFSGTSSGSILTVPLALGYRGEELKDIVMKQDFNAFQNPSAYEAFRIRSSLRNYGIVSGNELRRWVGLTIARRFGSSQLSFADLENFRQQAEAGNIEFFKEKVLQAQRHYTEFNRLADWEFAFDFMPKLTAETPQLSGKELDKAAEKMRELATRIRGVNVVASEVIQKEGRHKPMTFRQQVFNAKNTPEVKIAQAVRASAAFPFFFRHAHIDGKTYTDGGLTNLIPIDLMDETIPKEQSLAIHLKPVRKDVNYPIRHVKESDPSRRKWKELGIKLIHGVHVFRYAPTDIPMPHTTVTMEESGQQTHVSSRKGSFFERLRREVRRFRAAYNLTFVQEKKAEEGTNIDHIQLAAEDIFGKTVVRSLSKVAQTVQKEFWEKNSDRVVLLDRGNTRPTDFDLDQKGKEWLLKKGAQGMAEYLKEHGIEDPKALHEKSRRPQVQKAVPEPKRPEIKEHPRITQPRRQLDTRHR